MRLYSTKPFFGPLSTKDLGEQCAQVVHLILYVESSKLQDVFLEQRLCHISVESRKLHL